MQILHKNLKKGVIRFRVQDRDDLWYLSGCIEEADLITGRTIRKIKVGGSEEKASIIKKPVFISLKVEKVEFSRYSDVLRVSGTIKEAPEDIPLGSHHTFTLEENSVFQLTKERWPKYMLARLDEATKHSAKILIVVFDREEALFAILQKQGYELLSELKGDVSKKEAEESKANFYAEIEKQMEAYVSRFSVERIVVASPAFWKEYLLKEIHNEETKKKIILATCNAVGKSSISEILKRPELMQALREDRIIREEHLVENLLREISQNNLASYGFAETKAAIQSGAVAMLLVTDALIQEKRKQNKFNELEEIMHMAESMKGEVHIIDSENDAGKKLQGLGGIGAILRYKLNY